MIGIELNQVEKTYSTVKAVHSLSFKVEPGQIFALLGPNGAGKSSLIRMLVGLTMADAGEIRIFSSGQQIPKIPETSFGYLPEDRGLYPDKTVTENLSYIGKLRGLSKEQIQEQLAIWLPRFDLMDKVKDNLSKLSKGNQQKVQLISCLIHRPQLLILDEPFSGLDPINQEHVLSILNELKQSGTTILLSAHQMALVERLADAMLLLNKGQQVALGSLSEVIAQLSPEKFYQLSFASAVASDAIEACPAVKKVEVKSATQFVVQLHEGASVNQLLQQVMALGELVDFGRIQPSLHDLYLTAVQNHNGQQVASATMNEETTI
ncbi:ABC transporter ATP-binding protein [Undibacterium baiyunense]|uniref:ATP-binding cassette domain-containing protein n=1 Tax=Undibacterium baiyunense TaxID=2828731 RepID=A0A941DD53_9BURK|nr:ATP-binding cassette domain-containing protein [Undibacterium baiyunense]MBR7746534.1 ATP-binding cassette domain-containing protein [Undibacterium baiyunense]